MIEVIGNRVLIEIVEQQAKSAGGIIIPEAADKEFVFGIVISIGSSIECPVQVEEGSKIIVRKSKCLRTASDKNYYFVDYDDIFGVEKNDVL